MKNINMSLTSILYNLVPNCLDVYISVLFQYFTHLSMRNIIYIYIVLAQRL